MINSEVDRCAVIFLVPHTSPKAPVSASYAVDTCVPSLGVGGLTSRSFVRRSMS